MKEQAKKSQALTVMNFEEDAEGHFQDLTQDDFALPFIKCLSNTSPEINTLEGARPGLILNSVTQELFDGKQGIEIIPCGYVRQYLEWKAVGSKYPVNIYPATSDILSKTHKKPNDNRDWLDNGNYVENTANHYVMVVSEKIFPGLVVMKNTQLKKSRQWNSMMQTNTAKRKDGSTYIKPPFSRIYRLSTVAESNDKGNWFGWKIDKVRDLDEKDLILYKSCKDFATSIKTGGVEIKHTDDKPVVTDDVPF